MKVTLKAKMMPEILEAEYDVPEGTTVEELISLFLSGEAHPVPRENFLPLLNGKQAARAHVLAPGDHLELVMLLCGG